MIVLTFGKVYVVVRVAILFYDKIVSINIIMDCFSVVNVDEFVRLMDLVYPFFPKGEIFLLICTIKLR